MAISIVSNANIFIGAQQWLGSASSIELPEVTAITDDYSGLGHFGTLTAMLGFEAMTCTIEWTNIDDRLFRSLVDFTRSSQLQVWAHAQQADSVTQVASSHPVVIVMAARPVMVGLGEISKAEMMTTATEWAVERLKMSIRNKDILEIDVLANIYTVNGQDRMAQFRRNLGQQV